MAEIGHIGARGGRNGFNLVEVVLALAVVGVGLVSVLGLMPIAVKAGTDSLTQNYAAESVDYFLHVFATTLKDPANDYRNWDDFGQLLPADKPGAAEPTTAWTPSPWGNTPNTQIFYGGDRRQYYKIIRLGIASGHPDFSAVYRIWTSPLKCWRYEDDAWQEDDLDSSHARAIHLEVSWPAEAVYSQRRKTLYYLEVFKPI